MHNYIATLAKALKVYTFCLGPEFRTIKQRNKIFNKNIIGFLLNNNILDKNLVSLFDNF